MPFANLSNPTTSENKSNISYNYPKRSGTSGLSGQLYETKLLSLILLRALYDNNIKEFVLGTNIEGLGAFDDIVLRYESNIPKKTKIIFLQAKHKDNPSKERLKVEDIFKENEDFSLVKYFESYLKIIQKCISDKNNALFIDSADYTECEFIIYTSAREQFTKKRIIHYPDEHSYFRSNKHGKVFQFAYDNQDIDVFVSTIIKSRAISLAKSFAKFILKDNIDNMMQHDLIKIYHVYLAHNVITIESSDVPNEETCKGKFRESFWTNNDATLSLMRSIICKGITNYKGIKSTDQQHAVENIVKSHTFKLPINFGNNLFQFYGNQKKKQRRLEHLCSIFYKLLEIGNNKTSKHIFIKLDESSVGPGKIIQAKDLESYRLAGLVGNLLINDNETDMLKFNLNEQSLSNDNIQVLHHLKEKYNLSQFRFDINLYSFPKLTLYRKEHDRSLAINFLNKLKFYTDQAKEDEVENLLIQEINNCLNIEQKQHKINFRIKSDAIFLKVHDKIQKWWQSAHSASYLTKSCNFYEQVAEEVLTSSILNIIHYISCHKTKNSLVEFEHEAIDALKLDQFLHNDEQKLMIFTDQPNFSTKKVIQYFQAINMENEYIIIDFEYIFIENYLDIVRLETESTTISVLVMISPGNDRKQEIDRITNVFKGKIILIINNKSSDGSLKMTYSEFKIINDTGNKFNSLSRKLRDIILRERQVIFQGVKMYINQVFNDTILNILNPNLLRKVINNEELVIGNALTKTVNSETMNHYINRSVCRCIKLRLNQSDIQPYGEHNNMYLIRHQSNIRGCPLVLNQNKDIILKHKHNLILTTESQNDFIETCSVQRESNVHWFTKHTDCNFVIWKQTHGSIRNLMQYIDRATHQDFDSSRFSLQLNTLKDIQERVVLISAEAGMGKSTLLTHIAINTKRHYPNICILKLNCLDYVDQFNEWQEHKTHINFIEVMKFIYSTISNEFKNTSLIQECCKFLTVNHDYEIHLNQHCDENMSEVDLSEINLLNYFYNNNNLAVLFDGFDEICPDYAHEVTQLLCILKSSKVAHLWVTSRQYNVLEQLESCLDTFSFSINSLTKMEQKQYLQKIWSHQLGMNEKVNANIENFHSMIATVLNDIEGEFLSSPLHLYMIAEIYQGSFQDYVNERVTNECLKHRTDTSLITLYEKFMDIKFFNIHIIEKKKSLNLKDPNIRKMIGNERKLFVSNHKKIAVYLLLDKCVLLSKDDIKYVHEFIQNIKAGEEKTGIIECIVGDDPKFVHLTFAEYFAMEYIFDKITSHDCPPSLWKYIVECVLTSDKHGIRRFINSKFQNDQSDIICLKSDKKQMKTLFDVLLAQDNNLPATAMSVAIKENLDYIALFLLQSVKTTIDTNNLNNFIKYITRKCQVYCTFCAVIGKRNATLVQFILDIIKDIDCTKLKDLYYCEDINRFSPLLVALIDVQMSQLTLNSLQHDPKLMVELFTVRHKYGIVITAAHFLGRHGQTFNFCWNYLLKLTKQQLLAIFSVKDFEGQLPLHYAARENDYDFFTAMDYLLGREDFKKLCTTDDKNGFTPILSLPYHSTYFKRIKSILEKVYEVSNINEDFLFNELPKLNPRAYKHLGSGPYRSFRTLE